MWHLWTSFGQHDASFHEPYPSGSLLAGAWHLQLLSGSLLNSRAYRDSQLDSARFFAAKIEEYEKSKDTKKGTKWSQAVNSLRLMEAVGFAPLRAAKKLRRHFIVLETSDSSCISP